MNEVDTAILALVGDHVPDAAGADTTYFRDTIGVTVYDGWFKVPGPNEPQVDYPLPYANFMSSFGDDDKPRLSGLNAHREEFFRFYVVALTREQCKWAVGRLRAACEGKQLVVPGHYFSPIKVDSAPLITRDDTAPRPDGRPFFYAIDNYTIRFNIDRS